MFCGSRQIWFGGRGGKMALLIVTVADPCPTGHQATSPASLQGLRTSVASVEERAGGDEGDFPILQRVEKPSHLGPQERWNPEILFGL